MKLIEHKPGEWKDEEHAPGHRFRIHALECAGAIGDVDLAGIAMQTARYNLTAYGEIPAEHGLLADVSGDREDDCWRIKAKIRESTKAYSNLPAFIVEGVAHDIPPLYKGAEFTDILPRL